MSKKFLIITISVVLGLLLISLVGYYFILQNGGEAAGGVGGVFKNFFPFGGSSPTETPVAEESMASTTTPQAQANYAQRLRKITSEQVAGAGLLDVKAGTIIRHVEKATGHVYETELFSPRQIRISNTTIPVVYDVVWGNKNSSFIAKYLKDDNQTIDVYGFTVKEAASSTENAISAVKFPGNISDISVFGSSVFSLEQKETVSAGYTSNFDGSKRIQIWNSLIKELLSQYVNAKIVALTTKPDQNTEGYLFFVDTGNARVTEVLGNVPGLSTLVNDLASQVIYLDQSGTLKLSLLDVKNKSVQNITPTTFPEKCVWSKKDRNTVYCAVPEESLDRTSLTSWYLGLTSFTDDIWKYDIKNNTSSVILSLFNESGEWIDVTKLLLSENEQYLVFVNKIDNSLWSLDLAR